MSTNINVRPYNNKELLLFPPSVGDYLSKDHRAHVVDEAVEEIDLEPYYKKISSVGNPPYHPALMIKLWFYGYCVRAYSSRKIEERTHTDAAFIYLAGMQQPDFKAISEFRRKNRGELRNSFVDILQICYRLGMTKLGEISVDSKVIKANASADRTYDEKELIKERQGIQKAIEEYLDKANQTDFEEDQQYGSDRRGNELPVDIRKKEDRIKKMKSIAEQLKQAQETLKQSGKEKINLTDEDAQFQKGTGKIIPGYRGEIAVDSEEQIVVANDVSNEQSDQSQLMPIVDKVIENVDQVKDSSDNTISSENANVEQEKIKIIADSGYSSGNNLSELEKGKYKENIEPYIPDQVYQAREKSKKELPFAKDTFIYDEITDEFECPAGNTLQYIGDKIGRGNQLSTVYRYNDCNNCKYFGQCTTSDKGRTIQVSENEHLFKQMRENLSTPKGKKIYGIRKITAAPVIGNLSHNLGFREFLLRGEQRVKGEFSLMCSAHNLLKIARFVRDLGFTLKEALIMRNLSAVFDTS